MTTSELSKFWRDISIAYNQVAANHERNIVVTSQAEGLTAVIGYDIVNDAVGISILSGVDDDVKTGMEVL